MNGSGDAEAAAAASKLFESPDAHVRYDACRTLAALGAEAAAPYTQALQSLAVSDKDSDVKRSAKKALKDLSSGVKRAPIARASPAVAASRLADPKPVPPQHASSGPPPAIAGTARESVVAPSHILERPLAEATAAQTSNVSIAPAAVKSASAGVIEGSAEDVVEYCVMQGQVFKKLGNDPSQGKVTKLIFKVGTKVTCTGRSWTGPSGGVWVQTGPDAEKPGWLLVEGPGFGQPGPLLEQIAAGEDDHMLLNVQNPVDDSVFQICVKPDQRVRQAKAWIVLKIPGLKAESVVVTREREGRQDASFMLEDTMKMRDTPFSDGGELFFMYNGSVEADIEEHNAALAGATAK